MVRFHPFPGITVLYTEKVDGSIHSSQEAKQFFTHHGPRGRRPITLSLSHQAEVVVTVSGGTSTVVVADAVISTDLLFAPILRIADCIPIVLYDEKRRSLAIIHGSWRTLLLNIVEITILKMRLGGSDPHGLRAWFGPSLQPCCNRIQLLDVQDKFVGWKPYLHQKKDGIHLDMQAFARKSLIKNGVQEKHIIDSGICTYHNPASFFSHRRATEKKQPAEDGRMLLTVWRGND